MIREFVNWFSTSFSFEPFPVSTRDIKVGISYGKTEEGIIALSFTTPLISDNIILDVERNRNLSCKFYNSCLDFSWSEGAENFSCRSCDMFKEKEKKKG